MQAYLARRLLALVPALFFASLIVFVIVRLVPGSIIDLSASGAAIAAENRPPLKSLVMLGKVQSRVVRNLEEGFALEFVHEQIAETLEDAVTAR